MPTYTQLPSFTDGQILGRAQLDILRDNDEYFHAMAYRWRPVVNTMSNDPVAGQTDHTAWTGYIWIPSDATKISYWYEAQGGSSSITTRLSLYYGDGTTAVGDGNIIQQAVGTSTLTPVANNYIDLATALGVSSIDAGLYCLVLQCTKAITTTP